MADGEIKFGRFRLDLARRELRRDDKPVRLGGRALDILWLLASADGAVVTKDELMARVWAGVVVEEYEKGGIRNPDDDRNETAFDVL